MTLNPTPKAQIGICPGCGARIRFQQVESGEFVVCEECGDELEVVQMSPTIKLDWAYAEPYAGQDWDDDDNFDHNWYDEDDDDDDWDD